MIDLYLNIVLYYADFLSLLDTCHPVTDTCKYFFVFGVPVNSVFIAGNAPYFDKESQYIKQAKLELDVIYNKFGDEGVRDFIALIGYVGAAGSVDAIRLIKLIHQYDSNKVKKKAILKYYKWKDSQVFYHRVKDEDGIEHLVPCTKYIAHIENPNNERPDDDKTNRDRKEPGLQKSSRPDETTIEKDIKTHKGTIL